MEGGGREERIGTIPLTGAHIPHREGPEGKGAQVPALPCVSLWARGTRFWRGFPRNRARTLVENGWGRERKADREREREIGGPVRSLYFKQPRTCCNHLETMAHRSVRLAKRPGPDNSRDASSTTLRAILLLRLLRSIASPLAVLSLIFLSPWRIPAPSFEREKES